MIAKQILRSVLLIVVLGSLAIWANREFQKTKGIAEADKQQVPVESLPVVDGPQVVMTYFIEGTRCASCRKIEALTRDTAEKNFPSELASKKLIFRVIDTDSPADHHYLKDYQLSSKSVVISRRNDGRETAWQVMGNVWDLLDDPAAYQEYLSTQIREYLRP